MCSNWLSKLGDVHLWQAARSVLNVNVNVSSNGVILDMGQTLREVRMRTKNIFGRHNENLCPHFEEVII